MAKPKRPDDDPIDRIEIRIGAKAKQTLVSAHNLAHPNWSFSKWCNVVLLKEAAHVFKITERLAILRAADKGIK